MNTSITAAPALPSILELMQTEIKTALRATITEEALDSAAAFKLLIKLASDVKADAEAVVGYSYYDNEHEKVPVRLALLRVSMERLLDLINYREATQRFNAAQLLLAEQNETSDFSVE